MRNLDIGEVARQCRLPASALRFYEEKGLIKSIGRRGLRRVYAAQVTERLALIALGRAAGFSLDEIAQMFAPDGRVRIDRQKLAAKANGLGKQYDDLNYRDDQFDLSDATLAVSLAMLAITSLTGKRKLLYLALAFAAFCVLMGLAGLLGLALHPTALVKALT